MEGVFVAFRDGRFDTTIRPKRLDGLEVVFGEFVVGDDLMVDNNVCHVFLQRLAMLGACVTPAYLILRGVEFIF